MPEQALTPAELKEVDEWIKSAGGRAPVGPDPKKVARERAKNKQRRRSRKKNR